MTPDEVVNEAVAREREDCAQVAEWERGSDQVFLSDSPVPGKVCDTIAAAIRARGKESPVGDFESGEGIVLAQKAYKVMMRRGWGICRLPDGWGVLAPEKPVFPENRTIWGLWFGPDPLTALVEADRWYRENVEQGSPPAGRHDDAVTG